MTGSEVFALTDVRRAADEIRDAVHRTPVMRSRTLDDVVGAEVHLKCELFQRTGSFKFRGAYHFMSTLPAEDLRRGVCTVSAGNHAQAVALAARELGSTAEILMPSDAPPAKLSAVEGYGATVVTYDRQTVSQVEAGERFAAESDRTFVPAYDDPRIAAGAGTAVLELLEETGPLDAVVVAIGGGGAMSGAATVVRALHPQARVVGAEPAAAPVTKLSLAAGRRVEVPPAHHLADGQMLSTPGRWTFEVMHRHVDDVVAVPDESIVEAMAFLFDRLKLVTEPSGAIAAAAVMSAPASFAGRRVGVLVSGGNVGARRFADLMAPGHHPSEAEGRGPHGDE